jgi:hypothetical protein
VAAEPVVAHHGDRVSPAIHPGQAFDFDDWSQLARRDPRAFDARREAAIEDFLARAPGELRARLRGLQFRIDMERRRARTPMAACLRLSRLMWDSLLGDDGLQARLLRLADELARTPAPTAPPHAVATATVLPFRARP